MLLCTYKQTNSRIYSMVKGTYCRHSVLYSRALTRQSTETEDPAHHDDWYELACHPYDLAIDLQSSVNKI